MKALLSLAALGAALALSTQLALLGPVAGSLALLCACVGLAGLCNERYDALSCAAGALAALAFAALSPVSPALGGAAFSLLLWLPRVLRARRAVLRPTLAALALVGGALGASVHARYAVGLQLTLVASLVGAVLLLAPLLLAADDALTFELLQCAHECDEAARAMLLRAVVLRRRGDEALGTVPSRVRTRVKRAWDTVAAIARSRATGRAAQHAALDARLAAHLEVLEKLYSAAEARSTHLAGLDDRALHEARAEGDGLEHEARALGELERELTAPVSAA